MKRITSTLILVLALAATTGYAQKKNTATNKNQTVTIEHSQGVDAVPMHPQRIVTLNIGSIENLKLIHANIVGLPKLALPSYLNEYALNKSIANVGSLVKVDMETIKTLKPDLIIAGGRLSSSYNELSKIAPTIYPNNDYHDPMGALQKDLEILGKLFNQEGFYQKEYQKLENKIKRLQSKISKSDEKALVLLHNKGNFSAFGKGSRFGLAFGLLDVKEAAPELETGQRGFRATPEFIEEVNPDIIYIIDRSAAIGDTPLTMDELTDSKIRHTNAYKNGKIVFLDSKVWYLSGTGGLTSINKMIDEIASAMD